MANVMIAGHERDDGAGVSLGQHLPDNVAVDLWPVRRTLELPKIDDVTDEIEVLTVARVEEVEQRPGLAAACPEVDVAQPDRAEMRFLHNTSVPAPASRRLIKKSG